MRWVAELEIRFFPFRLGKKRGSSIRSCNIKAVTEQECKGGGAGRDGPAPTLHFLDKHQLLSDSKAACFQRQFVLDRRGATRRDAARLTLPSSSFM